MGIDDNPSYIHCALYKFVSLVNLNVEVDLSIDAADDDHDMKNMHTQSLQL